MIRVRAVNHSPRPDLRLGLGLGVRPAVARVGLTTELCLRRFVPQSSITIIVFKQTRKRTISVRIVLRPVFWMTTDCRLGRFVPRLR